jgi:flavin reductase (DIM6/NTAB) family NADH-FMN oxidoreductase RutF
MKRIEAVIKDAQGILECKILDVIPAKDHIDIHIPVYDIIAVQAALDLTKKLNGTSVEIMHYHSRGIEYISLDIKTFYMRDWLNE